MSRSTETAATTRAVRASIAAGVCAFAALLLPLAASASGVETRTVPSTATIEIKYNPSTSSQCGEEEFVRWPIQAGVTELRAKIFYFHNGVETYGSSRPPFDDSFERGGAVFPVPAGQHQWAMVGGSSSHLGGGTADCSNLRENNENYYSGPVRVELEVEVPESVPTDPNTSTPPAPSPPSAGDPAPAASCSAGELARQRRLQTRIKSARKGRRHALKRRGRLKHRIKKLAKVQRGMTGEERAAELIKLQHARRQMKQTIKQIAKSQKQIETMREKAAGACK